MITYLFNKMIPGIMTVMMMMVKMTVVETVRKCHHFDRVLQPGKNPHES